MWPVTQEIVAYATADLSAANADWRCEGGSYWSSGICLQEPPALYLQGQTKASKLWAYITDIKELHGMVSPFSSICSPSSKGQCTMKTPGLELKETHRNSDDSSVNISQPRGDGNRHIGELTRDFKIVESGHWSSNPSQSLLSIFRDQSACCGTQRLNFQEKETMICDGKSWVGFRGVDRGKMGTNFLKRT